MRRKLNQVLALLLCVMMMISDFTGFITPAQAAPADPAPDALSAAATPLALTPQGSDPLDFDVDGNGRPNLFVHFLGDNYYYKTAVNNGVQLGQLPIPAAYDQSSETNPDNPTTGNPMDAPGNRWNRYRDNGDMIGEGGAGPQVIFWVGLGIDRREILELLKDNQGLTSLEAGFYYDNRYIEPYVAPGKTYLQTIWDANINNSNYPANTQWSDQYEILRAKTGMEPATDLITQEEVLYPSYEQIMASRDWKMTYVSLELKGDPATVTTGRRLAGEYEGITRDTDGNPTSTIPASAHGTGMQNAGGVQAENDYQYLLLIPFRLKKYGNPYELALRLARNATHFSIGAGREGEKTYGAWERTTTRNPGKDIKLLTRFNGDLDLFGADHVVGEVEYSAQLHLDLKNQFNYAELAVDGDPAVYPVKATADQQIIRGLSPGLGMRIKTEPQSGYTVTVRVDYKVDEDTFFILSYQTVTPDEEYTFVMPTLPANVNPKQVHVWISFSADNPEYYVYLSELHRDERGNDEAAKPANNAVITTSMSAGATTATSKTINSNSTPYTRHPTHPAAIPLETHNLGPRALAEDNKQVYIQVSTHADYMAVVRLGNLNEANLMVYSLTITGTGASQPVTDPASADYGKIILPYGGTITLTMPTSDVDVEIIYQPAPRYQATLEVYHAPDNKATITDMNTAQLAYLSYDPYNVGSYAYSGVVYNLYDDTVPSAVVDDHRALKGRASKLPWVATSQAALSGSLGGDTGQTGATWNPSDLATADLIALGPNTVMAQLYNATTKANFAPGLSAVDLNGQDVGGLWAGIRKDVQGNGYSDNGTDVSQFKDYLWELKTRIESNPTAYGSYVKSVTQTVGGNTSTAYSYLDLTPAQVQAYVLDILTAQEIDRINQMQYDQAYLAYQELYNLWTEQDAQEALTGLVIEPEFPYAPGGLTEADSEGVRKYQNDEYQVDAVNHDGYLDHYYDYLDSYRTYITTVAANGTVTGITDPIDPPSAYPMTTIPLRPHDGNPTVDAMTMLRKYAFQPSPVSASATIYTRENRKVWVVAEGDSAYYVQKVEIYNVDSSGNATTLRTTITKDNNGYINVWSFDMPTANCVVRVTYALRNTRDLMVEIIGANDEAENLASVEAYRPWDHVSDPAHPYYSELPQTYPKLHVISNDGNQDKSPYPPAPVNPTDPDERYIYNVFIDGTVTLRVKHKAGYSVEVKVVNVLRGDEIIPAQSTAPNPADGDIYTFKVTDVPGYPGDWIRVTITYTEIKEEHMAHIRYYTEPNSDYIPGNTAFWRLESGLSVTYVADTPAYQGDHLVGDVTVQPGYYIYAVIARGASGNYTFVQSGNGYNNGYGTLISGTNQPVKINIDMPDEDLWVEVYFKKVEGESPPPEPVYALSLTVKDPDNPAFDNWNLSDKDTYPNNWAKATVYELDTDPAGGIPGVDLGPVGYRYDTFDPDQPSETIPKLTDHTYVQKGQWVLVEFGADTGYYVSNVTVGPGHLGITYTWESSTSISFYMPAGSAGVTVEFAKGEERERPAYYLWVRETWNGSDTVIADSQNNYVTFADSATIRSWYYQPADLVAADNPERVPGTTASSNARGAAVAGEKVTMTYIVDENQWQVESIVLVTPSGITTLNLAGKRDVTPATAAAGQKTYEIDFYMPSGDAEFVVHYRKGGGGGGDDDKKQSYPITVILYDPDNVAATPADNRFTASFTDPDSTTHADVVLGKALSGSPTTATRYIHPGDLVTLETQLTTGYYVDYVIINPSYLGLYPVWQTTDTATFTMPNQGVTVIARYIKSSGPHKYTANLILHAPSGYTVAQAGKGTFTAPTTGTLNNYPTQAVYSTSPAPGTTIDYDLYANDGFYIARVTIEPTVGTVASLTGSYGYQSGDFVMPAANVNVNVWFKKGWPDDSKHDLTLIVHDAAYNPAKSDNNYANFRSAGSTPFTGANAAKVYGGQRNTIQNVAFDNDVVIVDVHSADGYYYSSGTISVTDSSGNSVGWWYVPGGIAFYMPPKSTTVVITFRDRNDPDPSWRTYDAHLHVVNGNSSDYAKLEALPSYATNSPITYPTPVNVNHCAGVISNLYPQDQLTLDVRPGPGRHVAAVYITYSVGGDTQVIPIYQVNPGTTTMSSPATQAQFVPGDVNNIIRGLLAMPEHDIFVYVRFADGEIPPASPWISLWVSGANDAGYAYTEPSPMDLLVTTPGGTSPTGAEQGMDTKGAIAGQEVIATFKPSPGYDITDLRVYDKHGNPVSYQWISVIQDPPVLTDTSMWPAPPTDPSPGITHPNWVQNPERQIKLTVPLDSVTIHVTYGKVSDKVYTVQVVVNDPNPDRPSYNNAWVLDQGVREKIRTAKPGDWIDIDITVHPGYRIEYIKVVPQSYGIVPGLPLGDIYDQNTGFYMPNGDCIVYVKFVIDPTPLYTATVIATGAPIGNADNYATIHSPIGGTSAHAIVGGQSRSVPARPTVDWITVNYYWASTCAVDYITVRTQDGVDLVYTQNEDLANNHGQIVLPMASKNVIITIHYKNDPTPVGQEVVLHVIDKDRKLDPSKTPILLDPTGAGDTLNYGRVYWVGADTVSILADTQRIGPTVSDYEVTETIQIPAGQWAGVWANSDADDTDGNGKVYIESAFVLYEEGGQMLHMNLQPDSPGPGFSGHKESGFAVHQGRNDVYITLTRKIPTQNEYSAVLMLRGPEDDSGKADISVDADPVNRYDALAQANHGYAYVTATQGEGITITVTPAAGYVVDYIQVTPLGYPLSYTYTLVDGKITFDMPHCNIAITVYLKKAQTDQFTLTLHYIGYTGNEDKDDYARVHWTQDDGNVDTIWAWDDSNTGVNTPQGSLSNHWGSVSSTLVKGGALVTLRATLDNPDVILAAYVLSGGDLVPLTPTFPLGLSASDGLEGVGENTSMTDNALYDAEATFFMPDANTHVFLVTTNDPPEPGWHTVIVTAQDFAPTGNNSGKNRGYLSEEGWTVPSPIPNHGADNTPGGDFYAVESWGDDNVMLSHTFRIMYETDAATGNLNYFLVNTQPAPGYELSTSETYLIKNTPIYIQSLLPSGSAPNVYYRIPVGNCNKAVHLVFRSLDDLELTVEIDDPDNPGDGSVTNRVQADTTGLDTLHLASTSAAGSYQIMTGVTAAAPVDLVVTPDDGYEAYAFLYTVGADPVEVPLTWDSTNQTMTGSFPMPATNARVVVTFFVPYKGTLELIDHTADPDIKAQMTESTLTAPWQVDVDATTTSATLDKLPSGTRLDANLVDFDGANRKVTGLLTRNGSTTLMTGVDLNGDGVDHYLHDINRANATITLVVDEKDATNDRYIAAVNVVNPPKNLTMPTITTTAGGVMSGDIWTTSDPNATVTVHVTVPAGYTAKVTVNQNVSLSGVGTGGTMVATGNVTFTMPAANVQVTVEYISTHHRLTLHIVDTSGVADNTTELTPAATLGTPTSLTQNGQSTYVDKDRSLRLTARPATGAVLKRIFYQIAGDPTIHTVALTANNFNANLPDLMPDADMDVTVVYGKPETPPDPDDPVPKPDPEDYFIATAVKIAPDNNPDNEILSIQNTSRTKLLDGVTNLPKASPVWTAGYADDAVLVSFKAAPGYYVSVTAETADGTMTLPVLQLGTTTLGTATTAFPNPGKDIVIIVRYSLVPPPSQTKREDVALQLVEHAQETGNKAQTTDFNAGTLKVKGGTSTLALNGTYTLHDPHYPQGVVSDDPVEILGSYAMVDDDLRTLANWAVNSRVIRMTVAVRNTKTLAETGEVDLLVSWYGSNATSRTVAPPLNDDEIVVVRVYYGNLYDATLHIIGANPPFDETHATDNRNPTITSTGSDPITQTGDKLEQFVGDSGEIVETTAIPDSTGVGGTQKRLVGVVYESDLTGARPTTQNAADSNQYDFEMPKDDVDFYVVYEPESDNHSYIAKVALADDSAPIAGTQNALSIRNDSNAGAVKGKYWVAAHGGDSITVNVKVAQGYQAEIIQTYADHWNAADHTPNYDFYISRTLFVPNLSAGRDATFTMPVDTDATVTVRFTKGYDLSLEVRDDTDAGKVNTTNQVDLVYAAGTAEEDRLDWAADVNLQFKTVRIMTSNAGATGYAALYSSYSGNSIHSPGDGIFSYEIAALPLVSTLVLDCYWDPATRGAPSVSMRKGDAGTWTALPGGRVMMDAINGHCQITFTMPDLNGASRLDVVAVHPAATGYALAPFDAKLFAPITPYEFGLPDLDASADLFAVGPVIGGVTSTMENKEGGRPVKTTVSAYKPDVNIKLSLTTPFGGTQLRQLDTGSTADQFDMPYSDTLVSVLLDEGDDLRAYVSLAGDYTDINGNAADPIIDYTDRVETVLHTGDPNGDFYAPTNETKTGSVWTTTPRKDPTEGDTIDVGLTIAKGYMAKVKVRRDDEMYEQYPNDPSKWNYLDSDEYNFTLHWTQDDGAGSTEEKTTDLGSAGLEEIQINFNSKALPSNTNFPDDICGPQHFRFEMVDGRDSLNLCDVAVIVTFVKVTDMPRPFDPDNLKMDNIDLDRGFIYGENRGDYAIIDIPTLAQTDDPKAIELFDTDNWDAPKNWDDAPTNTIPTIHDPGKDAGKDLSRYIFALYDPDTGDYNELNETDDIMLVPYDKDTLAEPGDLYNFIQGMYEGYETLDKNTTTQRQFVGSKFLLLPKPKADGTFTTYGQKLYDMLDNDGSLARDEHGKLLTDENGQYYTLLYVKAEDDAWRQSDYTPVWIRPWFALGANVVSYAPTHELQGELYRLDDKDATDAQKALFTSYQLTADQEPDFADSIVLEDVARGSGKWLQVLRIRSSELLGGFDQSYNPDDATSNHLLANVKSTENLTYAVAIKKDANLTYRRVKLDLNPNTNTDLADYYLDGAPESRIFMIQDVIYLITGDVDGNGQVKVQDYNYVYDFVYRNRPWNNTVTEEPVQPTVPEPPAGSPPSAASALWDTYYADLSNWAISVYNPNSWSYRADLDGDRRLTTADTDIVRTLFNYNRTEADYDWRVMANGKIVSSCLPFGLGSVDKNIYASLFSLGALMEGEMPYDPYWDALVELDSEETVPLDTMWVDENGQLLSQEPVWDDDDGAETPVEDDLPEPTPGPGERVEIPEGDEVRERPDQPQAGRERPVERPSLGEAIPAEDESEPEIAPEPEAEPAPEIDPEPES